MSNSHQQLRSLTVTAALLLGSAACLTAGGASAAQRHGLQGPSTTTPAKVRNLNAANATVGNGSTQSSPILTRNVGKSSGRPLVGVGALSANPGHGGRVATVSLLNTNRLVGADLGSQGGKSRGGVAIINPRGAPVLSGKSGSPKGDYSHEIAINPAKPLAGGK